MSEALAISVEHNNVRLAGTLAFADAGVLASRIVFYSTPRPTFGALVSSAPLVTVVLTKPCGSIVNNALRLTQASPSGDLIIAQGSALWARWLNGAGDIVGEGDVSDQVGDGVFKISGTTGTLLYAGARAILGVTEIA